jgi:hypothetical protein
MVSPLPSHSSVPVTGRQCSRTTCAQPAAATLTYRYGHSHVWIDSLAVEREPHSYDLCEQHADTLSAPQGWRVDDRRRSAGPSLIAS